MHIFPGLNYFNGVQRFWKKRFTQRFLTIMDEYRSDIIICLGSHIHRMGFKSPWSVNYQNSGDDDLKLMVTPSISPVYRNNPGYTVMQIKDQ